MKLSRLLAKRLVVTMVLVMGVFAASNAAAQSQDLQASPTGPSPFTVRDLPSTEKVSPVNRPLLITGALVFGATWGTSIGFAYGSKRDEDQKYLYYPVAGPWLDLANRDCSARPCSNEDLNKALLIADGIGQGLGVLAILTSLFIPERTTRRWYLIGSDKSIVGSPMRVGTGYGIGAVGRF